MKQLLVRRFWIAVTSTLILAGLCWAVMSCVSLCKTQIEEFDEEKYKSARETYYEAFASYFYVIRMNNPNLLNRIPKKAVDPMGYHFRTVYLRRNAADFFKRTGGRALIGAQWPLLAALEPEKLPQGKILNNPAELIVWHNTDHYSGVHLTIEDDNGRILAEKSMREISHYQTLLDRNKIKLSYAEPTTSEGSVNIYSWSMETSTGIPSPFLKMRVRFSAHRHERWKNIDPKILKLFFEQQKLYKMAIYKEYRELLKPLLSDNITEPLTLQPVNFYKSILEADKEQFERVWQYGPLMVGIKPSLPGVLISNPAQFEIRHNSGDDVRLAITIFDDKKNILADFVIPHVGGLSSTLRRDRIEVNYKKPTTSKGNVRLSAIFPYTGSTGSRETLMEYTVKFAE